MNDKFEAKRVILITIDALRPDHLKTYGYHRNTAPNLDRFAKKGTTFMNAFTNGPETPSGFSALFTSTLPLMNGGFSPLPNQKIIFPQILKENDIFNYAIHSNPNLGRQNNYDRGFDTFLDGERFKQKPSSVRGTSIKSLVAYYIKKLLNFKGIIVKLMYKLVGFNKMKDWIRKKLPFLTEILLPFTPIAYDAPYIVDKLISFINQNKKNFFLWAHFMEVHSPFNPPSENLLLFSENDVELTEREFLNNQVYLKPQNYDITPDLLEKIKLLYDGEINHMDNYLGKFFKFLNEKVSKNCLVIITADHGESFYEHGYFFHQGNIYDELLKIPFFIIEIGNKTINRAENVVQLIDIAPTVLDYFNIPIPEQYKGKSLIRLLKGQKLEREDYVISETYQKNGKMKKNDKEGFALISIRTTAWKYIFDEEHNAEFLFNLKEDPGEKNNIIQQKPKVLSLFRNIKDDHLSRVDKSVEFAKITKAIETIDLKKLKL